MIQKILIGGVLLLLITFTVPVSAGEAVYDDDTQFDDLHVPGSSKLEKDMKNVWPALVATAVGVLADIGVVVVMCSI